jgi:NAD(P)-dependent dehydrogenase (short-subunit alcohol dehydrogenase family)
VGEEGDEGMSTRRAAARREHGAHGRLAGKVALVTGGANGIGRAIALRFAREGAAVALVDLDAPGAKQVAAEIGEAGGKALALRGDVARAADAKRTVAAAFERFGALHVLVNDAGVNVMKTVESATEADWTRALDVDLKGVWLFCKEALPHLRATRGAVINVASMHAFRTMPSSFPYAAAKAGVVALTRSLAIDAGPAGVRVNAICPGTIETKLTADWLAAQPDPEAARRRLLAAIPLKRLGTPDDVASLALFLAGDESSFLSGAALPLDGGRDALSAAVAD